MKKILFILMTIAVNLICFAQSNNISKNFVISDMKYDYELTYPYNSPKTEGTVSFIVHFNKPANRLLFKFTHQRYKNIDRIFYNNVKTYSDLREDDTSLDIVHGFNDWGTYFCIYVYFQDGTYEVSDVYCNTDLLSETDRQIIWDYSGVDNVETTESRIIFQDNSITVDAECGGELSFYDISGVNIKNVHFDARQPISIDDSFPKFFFAVARLDNGQVLTKKILRR